MEKNHENPLDQNLILKLVMEAVGKRDVADLKNCRLVSHSWNRVAVQVLEQQHSYALDLPLEKFLEFGSLLWNVKLLSKMDRRRKDVEEELASLRLSLGLHPNSCTNTQGQGWCSCSPLAETAQLLSKNPQLRVFSINFLFTDSSSSRFLLNHELFNFFSLVSNHLQRIIINNIHPALPQHFEQFEFTTNYSSLKFPTLSSMNFTIQNGQPRRNDGDPVHQQVVEDGDGNDHKEMLLDLTDVSRHLFFIVKNAPKLVKLRIELPERSEESSSNCFRAMIKTVAPRIEELIVDGGADGIMMRVLSTTQFPNLRSFCSWSGSRYFSSQFTQFLAHNSPSLTELEIGLKWCTEDLAAKGLTLLEFPSLPRIKHFGFFVRATTVNFAIEHTYAILNQLIRKLPSLRSLSTDLRVLFLLTHHLVLSNQLIPSPAQYPVFPDITTLQINIHPYPLRVFKLLKLNVLTRLIRHTCPNLKELVIKPKPLRGQLVLFDIFNDSSYSSDDEDEEEEEVAEAELLEERANLVGLSSLARAIKILCNHPGIQRLQIHNYAYDWLIQILTNIDQPFLQGLKSLALFAPAMFGDVGDGGDVRAPPRPRLKIMELLARLPALEHLQLGRETVCSAQVEIIRNVMKKFPNNSSSHRNY